METLTQLIVKPKNVSMLLYHLSLGVSCKWHFFGQRFFLGQETNWKMKLSRKFVNIDNSIAKENQLKTNF